MILNESAAVTLDSQGNGTVRLGPQKTSQRWRVTRASVLTSTSTKVPQFFLYYGPEDPANSLGGSFSGSNDSTDLDANVGPGQFLTGKWVGGDAGARATLSIYGDLISKAGV